MECWASCKYQVQAPTTTILQVEEENNRCYPFQEDDTGLFRDLSMDLTVPWCVQPVCMHGVEGYWRLGSQEFRVGLENSPVDNAIMCIHAEGPSGKITSKRVVISSTGMNAILPTSRHIGGILCSIPQCMTFDVQPLVKSSFFGYAFIRGYIHSFKDTFIHWASGIGGAHMHVSHRSAEHLRTPKDTLVIIRKQAENGHLWTLNQIEQIAIEWARRLGTTQILFGVMRICFVVLVSYLDGIYPPCWHQ